MTGLQISPERREQLVDTAKVTWCQCSGPFSDDMRAIVDAVLSELGITVTHPEQEQQ